MCSHEIKVRDGFDQSCFLERHFSWERVKGSIDGGTAPENDNAEALLGCACEEIEPGNKKTDSTEFSRT